MSIREEGGSKKLMLPEMAEKGPVYDGFVRAVPIPTLGKGRRGKSLFHYEWPDRGGRKRPFLLRGRQVCTSQSGGEEPSTS